MTLRGLFEKTVFVTGAGASMDAGCLSSKGMLDDLRRRIDGLSDTHPSQKAFDGIYDFILASLAYQNTIRTPHHRHAEPTINVEDFVMVLRQLVDREFVVPAPLIGNWNEKILGWELKNENVFGEFLSLATDLLVKEWTNHDAEGALRLTKPFRDLLEASEDFNVDIFSLNYDLIWESTLNSESETLVETGFSASRWTGEFEDPNNAAKLRLSKLHGSVNWYFDAETEEVRCAAEAVSAPLIIFGSSYKMQSFDPFISLLSRFRHRLNSSMLFVIVGYSFQDRYINNILIQSLSSDLMRSAIVVDPFAWNSSDELSKRVEDTQASRSISEMLNLKRINPQRVEIVRATAAEFYAEYLGNGAQKLKEKLHNVEEGEPMF